jgi:hypothetical protein
MRAAGCGRSSRAVESRSVFVVAPPLGTSSSSSKMIHHPRVFQVGRERGAHQLCSRILLGLREAGIKRAHFSKLRGLRSTRILAKPAPWHTSAGFSRVRPESSTPTLTPDPNMCREWKLSIFEEIAAFSRGSTWPWSRAASRVNCSAKHQNCVGCRVPNRSSGGPLKAKSDLVRIS